LAENNFGGIRVARIAACIFGWFKIAQGFFFMPVVMKSFRSISSRLAAPLALAALLLPQFRVSAQIPGGANGNANAVMNAVILRLFGSNTNFIARLDIRVLDKNQKETGSIPLGFERLGDKVRYDVNMAQVKSREMSPQFATTLKEMGLDQMEAIRLPERKMIVSVYPVLKAYAETPMEKDELEAATNHFKIEKKQLGHETIDGHACEKNEITVTEAGGHRDRAIVWNATDLKDFPIQMQIPADETTLVFKFKDVKFGRPEFSHFETPTGLTRYADVNALMADAVAKKMGAARPAK
jgi:hypothetical protein